MRTAIVRRVSVYEAVGDADGEESNGPEPEPLGPLNFAGECAQPAAGALARLGFAIDGGRAYPDAPSSDPRKRLEDVGSGMVAARS